MAPMSDEERRRTVEYLRDMVWGPVTSNSYIPAAENVLQRIEASGGTLTAPPAPEPTYTRTFTQSEWNIVNLALNDLQYNEDAHHNLRDRANQLFDAIRNLQPDPEPGA